MTQPSLPPEPSPVDAEAEPLITIGGVTALAVAVLALLVAFGVPLTERQQEAILGVLAAGAPIVTALWARAKMYSPRTVARLLANARATAIKPPS